MGKRSGVRVVSASSIQIEFTYRGVRCRERLRLTPTKPNLKFAENLRGQIENGITLGTFVYEKQFPDSRYLPLFAPIGALITVGDILDDYLGSSVDDHNAGKAKRKQLALSTWLDYRNSANHLKTGFGPTPLNQFSAKTVEQWLETKQMSFKRARNVLLPLRGALKLARKAGHITTNPLYGWQADDLNEPEESGRKIEPFSPSEIKAIVDAADGAIRNLIQFAFWTGLRTSELIALRWEDIKGETVHVSRAKVRGHIKPPKSAAGVRDVKLLKPALEAIKAQKPLTYFKQGFVFLAPNGEPWRSDNHLRNVAWIPTLKKAGVRYRYPYQTRHTYASMMCSTGENLHWIASQMGHSDIDMVIHNYGKWIPDANPTAGSKAEALWAS